MNTVLKAYAKAGDPEGATRVSYLIYFRSYLAKQLWKCYLEISSRGSPRSPPNFIPFSSLDTEVNGGHELTS